MEKMKGGVAVWQTRDAERKRGGQRIKGTERETEGRARLILYEVN